jgi:hypothetical protein
LKELTLSVSVARSLPVSNNPFDDRHGANLDGISAATPVCWYRLSSPTLEGIDVLNSANGVTALLSIWVPQAARRSSSPTKPFSNAFSRVAPRSGERRTSRVGGIVVRSLQSMSLNNNRAEMRIGQPAMNGMIAASRAATCFAQRTSRTSSWTTSVHPLRALSLALFGRCLVQITPAIVAWTS